MRLIDADALIKVIEDNYYYEHEPRTYTREIEDAPTVNQWIPVTEKLPEDMEQYRGRKAINVLICTSKGYVSSCNRQFDNFHKRWHWGRIKDVTAWMPLPEAYKED